MQLKPITAIAVLLLVVASLLVAGCINNTSPSSNTGGGNAGVVFTVNSQTTLNKLGSGVLSSTPKPGYKYDVFDVTVTNLNRNDLAMGNPQQGDVLQWDQSNKNYILTHGVSGVD
jgi:ABC-type oligopeptide transport system substrate-binding subunit